ncbi:MAG: bifunctional methylenetetrahydrofolate dehydrogenase/methenyltetrahydrofolate cyclohydrolase FolD [Ruminococcaceae bacterium]|nr:bifunctional methylenetetrahydrofolate dehydrogenase/methenyltetrahydrofolate cyclohydrolase FolD [Oscillospiraceae bacterium]
MAQIIDGKAVSLAERELLKEQVEKMDIKPGLAVILVGSDPASQVYVKNKKLGCAQVGIYSESYDLPEKTTEAELLDLIDKLNKKEDIHGILVQLPLPKHINETAVINAIVPEKDVDAFHPVNVGKIMTGDFDFLPCTPAGVMCLLSHYGIDPAGKECVVVGRSNIVGKPQAMLLLHANGTVTICHSKTKDLCQKCLSADILVAAVGKADFITGDMIKEGAVVIDVGINRRADGKLTGDVDFASCEPKASYITPVPGGVGPMTITMLLKNTVKAAELYSKK